MRKYLSTESSSDTIAPPEAPKMRISSGSRSMMGATTSSAARATHDRVKTTAHDSSITRTIRRTHHSPFRFVSGSHGSSHGSVVTALDGPPRIHLPDVHVDERVVRGHRRKAHLDGLERELVWSHLGHLDVGRFAADVLRQRRTADQPVVPWAAAAGNDVNRSTQPRAQDLQL